MFGRVYHFDLDMCRPTTARGLMVGLGYREEDAEAGLVERDTWR